MPNVKQARRRRLLKQILLFLMYVLGILCLAITVKYNAYTTLPFLVTVVSFGAFTVCGYLLFQRVGIFRGLPKGKVNGPVAILLTSALTLGLYGSGMLHLINRFCLVGAASVESVPITRKYESTNYYKSQPKTTLFVVGTWRGREIVNGYELYRKDEVDSAASIRLVVRQSVLGSYTITSLQLAK